MFASGGQNGEVLLWENKLRFFHGAHTSRIVELNYSRDVDLFLSVEEGKPAINLWKPMLLANKER
jgi:hypothetical protein